MDYNNYNSNYRNNNRYNNFDPNHMNRNYYYNYDNNYNNNYNYNRNYNYDNNNDNYYNNHYNNDSNYYNRNYNNTYDNNYNSNYDNYYNNYNNNLYNNFNNFDNNLYNNGFYMRNNGKGQTNNKSRNSRQATSYIRVLHASPGAPAVDVYADGTLLVSDLAFKEQSMYVRVPSGSYNVTVYPTGQTTDAVIDTTVEIPENAAFNAVAVGTLPDLSLMTIQEPNMPPETDEACVRFVHISPDAPNVDIRLEDGTNVFTDIGYKEESDYVCVDEGTYTFNVNPAGTDTTVLTVPDVSLDAKTYYTIYAVGLVDGTPELEALLITEPREED